MDLEMEFGAAVVAVDKSQKLAKDHLRKAIKNVEPGTALARCIESHLAIGGKTIKEIRANLGNADDTRAGK
jgi:hypothetical protein